MPALRSLVLLLALVCPRGQEPAEDLARSIAKHQAYLEQHPHHEQSFERWVSDAAAAGKLPELVLHYEGRLAADSEDLVARILLARLLAQRGELTHAITLMSEVRHPDADLEHLLGRLHLADRNPLLASVHLENAMETATEPRTREALLQELGGVYVGLGFEERAVASFRALAAIDPESFSLCMEAASRLVLCEALDPALEELARALDLAQGDSARRARVLGEIGSVEERAGRPERALEAYREARGLLGRGHWLQRELFARMLAIEERLGALDELVALCREGVAADPLDPQVRLDLAYALDRKGDRDGASSVLLGTAESFPSDLELGRTIIDRLLAMGRLDGASREFERLLAAHPEAIDLALDHGRMLAARGDREGARARWLRTIERFPSDPSLLRTVGIELLDAGWVEDAITLFSRAIGAAADDPRMVLELAGRLEERGAKSVGKAWIAAAETSARARRDAAALEVLADHCTETGEVRRSRVLYQAALDAGGDRPRLLERIMDLALAARDLPASMSCFRELAEGPCEPERLLGWTEAIARAHAAGRAIDRLLQEESRRAATSEELSPVLLVAQIQRERRDWDAARGPLLLQMVKRPEQAAPRLLLARVHEDAGEHALAAATYESLVELDPTRARNWLEKAVGAWYLAGDWQRLRTCHERLAAASPRDVDLAREIAAFYRKHTHPAEAYEFLERAVAARPDDGHARLELADLEIELGRSDEARENLRLALLSHDAEVRELACTRLESVLGTPAERELLIQDLARDYDADPSQAELALALAHLLARELEYERALAILDRALERSPRDTALATTRHQLNVYANSYAEVLRDLDAGVGTPLDASTRLALKMADAELARGGFEAARALLSGVEATEAVVAFYGLHGRSADALREFDQHSGTSPGSNGDAPLPREVRAHLHMERAGLLRSAGRLRSASEELVAIVSEEPSARVAWRELGETATHLGDRKRALASGTALLGLCAIRVPRDASGKPTDTSASKAAQAWLASPVYAERVAEVRDFFVERKLYRELAELAAAESRSEPLNLPMLDAALDAYGGWGRQRARALLALVEKSTNAPGALPEDWDGEAWKQQLAARRERIEHPVAHTR